MVQNIYLQEIAKAAAGQSYTMPLYLAVGTTQITSIPSDLASLPGEAGTRVLLTRSSDNKDAGYNGIRQSVQITDPVGQQIYWVALFPTDTGGTPYVVNIIPGLTQNTTFDLDMDYTISYSRI